MTEASFQSEGPGGRLTSMRRWHANVMDYVRRPVHYIRSQRVDVSRVNTVCLAWGPNRNMTTLTASLIALHPNCQVLNNAGKRHMDQAAALLDDPSPSEFERFVRSTIFKSQGGKHGPYGGTITLSHAFGRPAMREPFLRRYGHTVIKDDIRCVYWKSAVYLTTFVREHGISPAEVATRNPGVRFLMPIRNPLDCAMSNFRTGHYRHFPEVRGEPIGKVLDFLVQLIADFLDARQRCPESFFCYHEQEFGRPVLEQLAAFLGVDADETWIQDCLRSQPKGRPYEYEPELLESYRRSLQEHLQRHPGTQRKLAGWAGIQV